MVVVLPFFYVYGLSLLHTHVAVGASLVLVNSLAFPNVVVNAIRSHGVTGFAGVPSTFALMLERSNLATTSLPTLRYATQAGGAMPPARIRQWLAAMPSVPLFIMYGATEASARLAYLDPAELPARIGSIGRAIPNVELVVLKDDGTPARPGESGEIVARGSNMSSGYWNHPQETAERFRPEGFRTGDLGTFDEHGCLSVVGRLGDMLKIGGHRVSAREIEDAISECPGVYECAVVAIDHEILGQAPVAFVTLQDDASTDAVTAFSRANLSEAKVPVAVIACPELPKNASGKVDKRQLRAGMTRHGGDGEMSGVRTLVVAYDFPPHAAIGTQRTLRFVRHIDAEGWPVAVLTGDPARFRKGTPVDHALLHRVPASVDVIRTTVLRPIDAFSALVRGRSAASPASTGDGLRTAGGQGLTAIHHPGDQAVDRRCFDDPRRRGGVADPNG